MAEEAGQTSNTIKTQAPLSLRSSHNKHLVEVQASLEVGTGVVDKVEEVLRRCRLTRHKVPVKGKSVAVLGDR